MHNPVLLEEMINLLDPKDSGIYIDPTFGYGGYTKEILKKAPNSKIFAFDRDPDTKKYSNNLPINFINTAFSKIPEYVSKKIDGITYDFGLSSMQIENADRGFSFYHDGPLDMRMSKEGESALEVVNTYKESEIKEIIETYGEDPKAHKIAKLIVRNRPFFRTRELSVLIKNHISSIRKIHPATLTFQAIRIYINDELLEIKKSLENVYPLLKSGGKIICVSFHCLEDRIVKQFMNNFSFSLKKKIFPSKSEIKQNPRSRSAVLRYAIKT